MTDTAALREAAEYAERLAISLHSKHFAETAPQWKPLSGDLVGLLTQIDNLTAGLRASPAPDRVSDEMVERGCEKACWLAEPYTAQREGGVPIECDISEADAEEINRLARREMRAILEAALSEASK